MKWSWRIGRIAGVDIYIHATFLLLLVWIGARHWIEQESATAMLEGIGFILTIFACIILHELGHALAARRFGIRTRDITILPIGGVARLERMPREPLHELWVAAAGPLVNVIIATSLFIGLLITATWTPIEQLRVGSGSFTARILAMNVFLVVFNLIPAFPMDGGRMLRAILALSMDYTAATQIAASIGQAIALVFGFLGFFWNPFLLFIALFVWIGAAQEASMAQINSAFAGIPARRAMLTEFHTLRPDDRLSTAMDLTLTGYQTDFPVVDEAGFRGILTSTSLLNALAKQGPLLAVADVMQTEFEFVDPDEMLDAAFAKLQRCECRALPVIQSGQLVGLLTTENVGEFLMIQSALARSRQSTSVK